MKFIKAPTGCNPVGPAPGPAVGIMLLFLLFGLFYPALSAEKNAASPLVYLSGQTIFYAGESYTLSWQKKSGFPGQYPALMLTLHAGGRAVVKQQLKQRFPLEVTLRYPGVRPGVIVKTILTISVPGKENSWRSIYSRELYFASQAFRTGLEKLFTAPDAVGLLPGSIPSAVGTAVGTLKEFLRGAGLPFTEITSVNDFQGRWLICGGINFSKSPGLMEELWNAVRRGVSVILFPPLQGNFKLPPYEKGLGLVIGDETTIRGLDHRLDPVTAAPGPQVPGVYFLYHAAHDEALLKCSDQGPGFTWIEFKHPRAGLYAWGWNPAEMAELNPAAVILLRKLLSPKGEGKK